MMPATPPVLCMIGLSGCGKTTLTALLIETLAMRGLKIGALKHASHGFQMDKRGKDSDRFRRAGAYAIGIASDTERAVITSTPRPSTLSELVGTLPPGLDLVICEGFASEPAIKIGVHRVGAPLPSDLEGLIAVVGAGTSYTWLPSFEANELEAVAQFILHRFGLSTEMSGAAKPALRKPAPASL